MKVKNSRRVGLILMVLGVFAVLGSCVWWWDPSSNSDIVKRIRSFEVELNSFDRSQAYRHFYSGISDYHDMQRFPASFWSDFGTAESYEFSDIIDSESLLTASADLIVYGPERQFLRSVRVLFTFKTVSGSILISGFDCSEYYRFVVG